MSVCFCDVVHLSTGTQQVPSFTTHFLSSTQQTTMSNKYLPEEELNLHVEDYGTAFKIDRKNSSEANDEDSEKSAASHSKKATDSEKRPSNFFVTLNEK